MRHYGFVIVLILFLSTLPVQAAPPQVRITITANGFNPAQLVVAPGATVTWFNGTVALHRIIADDGSFDSGDIDPLGGSFSYTFSTPGRYAYHDGGATDSTGLIIVNAPPAATYLPLIQAVPPPPPPLDRLILQFSDIRPAFGRTKLTITTAEEAAANNPERAAAYAAQGREDGISVSYERRNTLYDGPIVIDQDLVRYHAPDGAALAFVDSAAVEIGNGWQRAEMATVGDQSTAWTYAEADEDGYVLRVFAVIAQRGRYTTLVFSGGLEGEVTTVSAYQLATRAVEKLPVP